MPRNIILDTNVLLYDPRAIFGFRGDNLLIPIEVIEEIDDVKWDASELGRNSRAVAQILDGLRDSGKLGEGVRLEHDGILRVVCDPQNTPLPGDPALKHVGSRILALAVHLKQATPEDEVLVVTKNVNLRLKADALGIPAQDYTVDSFPEADQYLGWHSVETASADVVDRLREGNSVEVPGSVCALPNEYFAFRTSPDAEPMATGRFNQELGSIVPLSSPKNGAVCIRSLNLQQSFAFDALFNDAVNLVTLTGKAGTGKTLLAIAAGLHKVFAEDRYNRLLIFRPIMPVGRDIGFLPGDVEEKMRPWMQPIYDALELIRQQNRRNPDRQLPPDILECEEISIEPLTYIRGRSIPQQYIIIDEAQNMTPLEVKTVITRVGTGTKVVLTGDPHQIDNPYVDAVSNGLAFLISRFRSNPLSAHISLVKGERSVLAETAADLL